MIVTASLTSGNARAVHGMRAATELISEIITLDHTDWETTLSVGDVEYRTTRDGPYPNHQMRISVRPTTGLSALNYTDHDDIAMPMANSYNPNPSLPAVDLVFNGATGTVFP